MSQRKFSLFKRFDGEPQQFVVPTTTTTSPPSLLTRRLPKVPSFSSLGLFAQAGGGEDDFPFKTNEESKEDGEEDDEFSAMLQCVIADRESRQALINALLHHPGEYIQKIRFVSCVDEYLRASASANPGMAQEKARDICRFFVETNAPFHCSGIPTKAEARLRNGVFDDFPHIRAMFLGQLARSAEVREAMQKLTTVVAANAEHAALTRTYSPV